MPGATLEVGYPTCELGAYHEVKYSVERDESI